MTAHRRAFGFLLFLATCPLAWGQQPPAPVRTAVAEVVEVASGVDLVGDIEASRKSLVASKEAGTVVAYPRREGDYVREGDLLAQLETTVLNWELKSAEAMRDARMQELAEMKNGTRSEVVAAAKARMEAARSIKKMVGIRLGRVLRLSQKSASSQEELEQAQSAADTADQEFLRAEAEWQEADKGPRSEKILQGESILAAQEAVVARLRSLIERHSVRAPFDGFITRESTEVGEWVEQGGPVVEMVEIDQVDVRVMVPARYAGRVGLGEEVRVEVESVPDRLLLGRVRSVVPEVDLRSRLFPTFVRLDNVIVGKLPALRPGMLTRVNLPVGEKRKGVFVPKDAIVLTLDEPIVYLVRSAGVGGSTPPTTTVEQVKVRLGIAHGNQIEIQQGIVAGDSVVVEGNERLQGGMPVQVLARNASK